MPPAERNNTPSRRNQIPPAKVAKVERTHEENQERAYIAASRRSDRSLEARVESARRASEIHKRRTGRSLRVTEQDVINEEMYEEEEDDLPMQYRRLAAHLQTGQHNFDRRLSEYLNANLGMRAMMAQNPANGITPFHQMPQHQQQQQFGYPHQSYPQQFTNPSMFQSQMMGQAIPRPQQPNAQTTYRPRPYYHQRLQQQDMPMRRQSVAQTQDDSTPQQNSMMAHPNNDPQSSVATTMTMPETPQESSEKPVSRKPSFAPGSFSTFIPPLQAETEANLPQQQNSGNPSNPGGMGNMSNMSNMNNTGNITNFSTEGINYSPFSTALPTNVQQFFGPTFDLNGPLASQFKAGHNPSQEWSNCNTSFSESSHLGKHPSRGMNSMLSRSDSQLKLENFNIEQPSLDQQEISSPGLILEDSFGDGADFNYDEFLYDETALFE